MLTGPRNNSYCPKLCRFSCSLRTNTSRKYPFLAVFATCKIPRAEIWKFFTGVRMQTPIHVLCFKSCQNRCKISVRKSTLYWWQKKQNVLAPIVATPLPHIFCVSAPHDPSLIFQVSSIQVSGDITANLPLQKPPRVKQYRPEASSLHNTLFHCKMYYNGSITVWQITHRCQKAATCQEISIKSWW